MTKAVLLPSWASSYADAPLQRRYSTNCPSVSRQQASGDDTWLCDDNCPFGIDRLCQIDHQSAAITYTSNTCGNIVQQQYTPNTGGRGPAQITGYACDPSDRCLSD